MQQQQDRADRKVDVLENRSRNGLLYVRIKTFKNGLDPFIPGWREEDSLDASEPHSGVDLLHQDRASHPVGAQSTLSECRHLLCAAFMNGSAFPSN